MPYSIYNIDGSIKVPNVLIKHVSTFLKPSYIETTIKSPSVITFAIGDYIIWHGERYSLYDMPQPTKTARAYSCGDAFEYDGIKFYEKTKDLECLFQDYVLDDNNIHYTTLPDISTFESVYGIADRIQANMNINYPNDKWSISVIETNDIDLLKILNECTEFVANNATCLDVLTQVYEQRKGIGWIYQYNTTTSTHCIIIGKANIQSSDNTSSVFMYGKGKGLRLIKKSVKENDITTRLIALGTNKNLPSRYYNNLTLQDEPTYHLVPNSVYIPNLMIPHSRWGTKQVKKWVLGNSVLYTDVNKDNIGDKAQNENGDIYIISATGANTITISQGTYTYSATLSVPDKDSVFIDADSESIGRYGIRKRRITYDGQGDNIEIYPSIEGMTFEELRAAKNALGETDNIPTAKYNDADLINIIASCSNPIDNGVLYENGDKYILKYPTTNLGGTIAGTFPERTHRVDLGEMFIVNDAASGELTLITADKKLFDITTTTMEIDSIGMKYQVIENGGIVKTIEQLFIVNGNNCEVNIPEIKYTHNGVSSRISINVIAVLHFEQEPPSNEEYEYDYNITTHSLSSYWGVINSIKNTFTINIKQIGFDIRDKGSTGGDSKPIIALKSGHCAGRQYEINESKYDANNDEWILTCQRELDNNIGQVFPNALFPIKTGDSFVLLGIYMNKIYVEASSIRLYNNALKDLNYYSKPRYTYEPEIDRIQMAESNQRLMAGMYFSIKDDDIGDDTVLIDSFTTEEVRNSLNKYEIVLRDYKKGNIIKKMLSQQHTAAENVKRSQSRTNISPVMVKSEEENSGNGSSGRMYAAIEHDHAGQLIRPATFIIPSSLPTGLTATELALYVSALGAGAETPTGGGGSDVAWGASTEQYVSLQVGNEAKSISLSSHTHSQYALQSWVENKGYLVATETNKSNWDSAFSLMHSHSNKSILDATTASFLAAEKTKLSGIETGANKYIHPSSHPLDILSDLNSSWDAALKATKPNWVLEGDSRLSNDRPASDVYAWAKNSEKPAYTWSEIDSKPSTFTPSSHIHDDRYYTTNYIDEKLSAVHKQTSQYVGGTGWKRIAYFPNYASCYGVISVNNRWGNMAPYGLMIAFNAAYTSAVPACISQISGFSEFFSHCRIVQSTTGCYLELYKKYSTSDLCHFVLSNCIEEAVLYDSIGSGSVPSGYVAHELALGNGMATNFDVTAKENVFKNLRLPSSAPSSPTSGESYLFISSLGTGATIN